MVKVKGNRGYRLGSIWVRGFRYSWLGIRVDME